MKGNLSHKIYPFPHLLPQTIETKRKPNNLWVFARENKVVFANRMRKKHHFSCLFILPLFESFRDIATDWTIASYLTFRRSITRQKTNFSNNEIIRQGNHYKQNREKRNVDASNIEGLIKYMISPRNIFVELHESRSLSFIKRLVKGPF